MAAAEDFPRYPLSNRINGVLCPAIGSLWVRRWADGKYNEIGVTKILLVEAAVDPSGEDRTYVYANDSLGREWVFRAERFSDPLEFEPVSSSLLDERNAKLAGLRHFGSYVAAEARLRARHETQP